MGGFRRGRNGKAFRHSTAPYDPWRTLRDATVSGLGVAYLSTWLAVDDLHSGRLEVVPIPTPTEDVPITALWSRSRDRASKIRVAVDALIEAF
ncbi:hypothetical protein ECB98_24435 [Brucellaceae bacterium VT-16-1752]|nr:hypothetical protein ECB98_24435 [Brucellaceae bacterium VT-16-1752]